VRVDDRQFATSGEELSSPVPRQGLSTCVSGLLPSVSKLFDHHDHLVPFFSFAGDQIIV